MTPPFRRFVPYRVVAEKVLEREFRLWRMPTGSSEPDERRMTGHQLYEGVCNGTLTFSGPNEVQVDEGRPYAFTNVLQPDPLAAPAAALIGAVLTQLPNSDADEKGWRLRHQAIRGTAAFYFLHYSRTSNDYHSFNFYSLFAVVEGLRKEFCMGFTDSRGLLEELFEEIPASSPSQGTNDAWRRAFAIVDYRQLLRTSESERGQFLATVLALSTRAEPGDHLDTLLALTDTGMPASLPALDFSARCQSHGDDQEVAPKVPVRTTYQDRLAGTFGLIVLALAVAVGWTWVIAAHKLIGDGVATTGGAVGAYLIGLVLLFAYGQQEEAQHNAAWSGGVTVSAFILLLPPAWMLLTAIRWAWGNPLF